MNTPPIDQAKVESFALRAMGDFAAAYGGLMVSLGAKLGLYRALAGAGPLGARELAARAGCAERYVREWLNAQAASGYIGYHAISDTYELSPEHALVLADEDSPAYIPHAWNIPPALWRAEDKAIEAFRTGAGIAWGDHEDRLHCGVAAFYRNSYRSELVSRWLPALDGVVERLEAGITVADVGCGHGHSTALMAQAFPRSRFYGFDAHAPSIEAARRHAAEAGVARRASFDVATAADYLDRRYGLICFFDCLHDLGDPDRKS
ncbi:MAG TPA: SAM-dependent methyltransferase, partial [Candidatus Competibacteraceae bacterium]|nr:SAM-dependent methyltransferase [Candidatus Competibacteraceae bacterium]